MGSLRLQIGDVDDHVDHIATIFGNNDIEPQPVIKNMCQTGTLPETDNTNTYKMVWLEFSFPFGMSQTGRCYVSYLEYNMLHVTVLENVVMLEFTRLLLFSV